MKFFLFESGRRGGQNALLVSFVNALCSCDVKRGFQISSDTNFMPFAARAAPDLALIIVTWIRNIFGLRESE